MNELGRRMGLTWTAFGQLNFIFEQSIYIIHILPVMTYGSATLTLTTAAGIMDGIL